MSFLRPHLRPVLRPFYPAASAFHLLLPSCPVSGFELVLSCFLDVLDIL